MIPISLTIRGLYSYQQPQTIQFDRLIEAQLFGIFGAVGSGKSSILEAISFALYGETERLNSRDNRAYNMMNLKSNELLIDFVFRNPDDQVYRFLVKGKRHGKDFDKVNTYERTAYRWVESLWRPLESNVATDLLGLSYDNFRRTVIIPQGKFQEFLQLGDKDRSHMLKEIFQLHKYEFFDQTTSLERKNKEAINNLTGKLSGYVQENEEAITDLEIWLKKEKETLEQDETGLKEKEIACQLQEKLQQLHSEMQQQQEALGHLNAQAPHYRKLEQQLEAFEYCRDHFREHLNVLGHAQTQLALYQQQQVRTQQQLAKASQQLLIVQKEYEQATLAFAQQEVQQQTLQDYQTLQHLENISQELQALQQRMDKGLAILQEATTAKELTEKQWETGKQKLATAKASLPDTSIIAPMKQWYHIRDTYGQQHAALEKQLQEIRQRKDQLSRDLQQHVPLQEKETLQALLEQQRDELNRYQLQLKLGEYSQALQQGIPCPLCGATEHPHILEVTDTETQLRQLEHEYKQTQLSLDQAIASIQQKVVLEERHSGLEEQALRIKMELDKTKQGLVTHIGTFVWPNFDPDAPQLLDAYSQQAEAKQQQLELSEQAVDIAEKQLAKTRTDMERYDKALQKIQLEQAALDASRATLRAQLHQLKEELLNELDGAALDSLIGELGNVLSGSKKRYEDSRMDLDAHLHTVSTLTAQEQALGQQIDAFQQQCDQMKQLIGEALQASPFTQLEKVEQILAEQLPVDKLRQELNSFRQQIHTAAQRLQDTRKKLSGQVFDKAAFQALKAQIEHLSERISLRRETYIRQKAAYERQVKRLQEKRLLEDELAKFEQRAEQLSTLKTLFKGNGFVNYISTAYLNNLCQAANERFYKLTRQQLRLEINDKNDFQIRDFLNDGKLRSVKTLSGGQTFQASLSLALALAESVQQQNRSKQNFFFLDEGFGSLDKDALLTAFDTLKSLRRENRIVGIISHVEELQQEIDVYLRIMNDPDLGSIIHSN